MQIGMKPQPAWAVRPPTFAVMVIAKRYNGNPFSCPTSRQAGVSKVNFEKVLFAHPDQGSYPPKPSGRHHPVINMQIYWPCQIARSQPISYFVFL